MQGGYARSHKGGIGATIGLAPLVLRDTLERVPKHDEFFTGAVGLPIAFTERAEQFTVSGFLVPTAVLGGVRTRAYGVYTDSLGVSHDGTGSYRNGAGRFVLAMGVAAVEPTSGLGLQLSAQRIAGDGAAWGGGVGQTWQTWKW